ncbi:hypothetical protein L195_g008398 [Trifolium pratense]|uniref:Uncharacterized protein n=1 Tax=Trifolium pratense TaxID=57577 RepID=A0A2K3P930_TRIPR|nr:hypothetical protein L195_g008398 [Trifolium pratense]
MNISGCDERLMVHLQWTCLRRINLGINNPNLQKNSFYKFLSLSSLSPSQAAHSSLSRTDESSSVFIMNTKTTAADHRLAQIPDKKTPHRLVFGGGDTALET